MTADPLLGATLGNYRVEAALGAGGMGRVYRGRHTRLAGQQVAIKVMDPGQAHDPAFRARFEREAQAVAGLRHAHIVRLYDFGEEQGLPYFVMELVDGGTLRSLLWQYEDAGRQLPLNLGLDLMHQAAEGLAYAHAQGCVHRDLKPDNLFLDRAGGAIASRSATSG